MKYKLSKQAERELDRELIYSAEKWGKKHAIRYARELQHKFQLIANNPFIYPEVRDICEHVRICRFKGNMIAYTVIEKQNMLIILGFFSIHQNIDQINFTKRF